MPSLSKPSAERIKNAKLLFSFYVKFFWNKINFEKIIFIRDSYNCFRHPDFVRFNYY